MKICNYEKAAEEIIETMFHLGFTTEEKVNGPTFKALLIEIMEKNSLNDNDLCINS
jgi:hypothetical protein